MTPNAPAGSSVPDDAVAFTRIVSEFAKKLRAFQETGLPLGFAHQLFEPDRVDQAAFQDRVPKESWWDKMDSFLDDLTNTAFNNVIAEYGIQGELRPLAGAVSRHEPVLLKVPHYFFPSVAAWSEVINGNIEDHLRALQQNAVSGPEFKRVRGPNDIPGKEDGLIPLLEHTAIYPDDTSVVSLK